MTRDWLSLTMEHNGVEILYRVDAIESIAAVTDGTSWVAGVSGENVHVKQSLDDIRKVLGFRWSQMEGVSEEEEQRDGDSS